ncbi:hypothetical protein QUF50_00905 [Thiotrichales bacterium HSG1]|nr:hypothetical protein [Thiotrichales bacterium HSG1]
MKYRYGSHIVYNIEYHFVWVIKHRYQTGCTRIFGAGYWRKGKKLYEQRNSI